MPAAPLQLVLPSPPGPDDPVPYGALGDISVLLSGALLVALLVGAIVCWRRALALVA